MEEQSLYRCPVFFGLQRPFFFFGLEGRYITWAGVSVGTAVFFLIIVSLVWSFIYGILVAGVILFIGGGSILFHQKEGLFSKKKTTGRFVYVRGVMR